MNQEVREAIEETLEKLRRPNLEREVIAMLAVRLIELRHPGKRVELASEAEIKTTDADGKSGSMYLNNLWVECERSPENRAELVDRYVRVLAPTVEEEGDVEHRPENIVALVRNQTYRDFVRDEDTDLVTRHLVGDLWIVYALDLPESTLVLAKDKALGWGLDSSTMFEIGVRNVERLLGETHFTAYGECFTVGCELISYASSLLLLNYIWDQAATVVQGDPVVAVPARDTVLFTGSGNAKGLSELSEAVRHVTSNGHHVISEVLLRRSDSQWKVFL